MSKNRDRGTALTFWVDGRPVPKKRPRVVRGHAYTPAATQAWEQQVAWAFRQQFGAVEPLEGDVSVGLDVAFPDRRHGDLDNYVKAVLDALNGVAWIDDKQVAHISVCRTYSKERPGVMVALVEMD